MRFILENIAKPLSRRIGTSFAGMLVALDAAQPDQFDTVETVATSLILVGIDMILSWHERYRKSN